MKKFVSLLLALCMVCALGLPAFADMVELVPEEAPAVAENTPAEPVQPETVLETPKGEAPEEAPLLPDDAEKMEKSEKIVSVDHEKGAINYQPGAKLQFGYGPGLEKLYMHPGAIAWVPVVAPGLDPNEDVVAKVTGAYFTEKDKAVQLSYSQPDDQQGILLFAMNSAGTVFSGAGKCIIYLQFNGGVNNGGSEAAMHVEIVPAGGAMPGAALTNDLTMPYNGIALISQLFQAPGVGDVELRYLEADPWTATGGRLDDGQYAFQVTATNGSNTSKLYYSVASESMRTQWAPVANLKAPAQPTQATYDFVRRLYQKVLNRTPDEQGLNDWAYALTDGTFTGATAAENFVFGKEFTGRNVSDEQFVNIMYETFMNRAADASGKKMWLDYLAGGVSRKHVCKGFIDSGEFGKICSQYGIQRGSMVLTDYADQNYGLTMFINRLYTKALARPADRSGVETWCKFVRTGEGSLVAVAHNIVFSAEFTNKKLSDTEYIKAMYRTFMDREADASSLASWQNYLKAGHTREEVFNGFAYSPEFTKLMESYGLYGGV